MRLTGFDSLTDLKATVGRARSTVDRLAPLQRWFAREIRKYPKLAVAVDAIAAGWTQLVESFCALIDPYLSRYFPDIRLVAVTTASGDVELHRIIKGVPKPLGLLTTIGSMEKTEIAQTKWTAIELRLRSDQLLQRTLSLPAASRDFLGPIIEHRLERLTPWVPDRVLYGYRPLAEPEPGAALSVALTATSKDCIAAPLKALGDAGLVPTAIGAQEDSLGEPLRVNLFRGTAKAVRVDSRRIVSRISLASFCLLSVIYLASSFWAASESDRQQEAGVRLLKARHLLKAASMGAFGDRERTLLEAKQPDKAIVVLIDKLATAIPQDTYLKELAVTPDKVRLVGISRNAPALVGELEATGLVNVRFTSAVTREKDQTDSFEITADRAAPAVEQEP